MKVFHLVVILLFLTLIPACEKEPPPPPPPEVSILFFNDLHGHLAPFPQRYRSSTKIGGMARIQGLVKKIRAENAKKGTPTLLFFAGDMFQGTPISSQFKGEAEWRAMQQLKPDLVTLGNHDFDFGLANLQRLMEEVPLPIVSANTHWKKDMELFTEPFRILALPNRLRVGVIGLINEDTPTTTFPSNVAPLAFSSSELATQRFIDEVEALSDILVLLSHTGYEMDRQLSVRFPQVDLIVGGHSHDKLTNQQNTSGHTTIVQTGSRGAYLGRIDLRVENGQVSVIKNELIPVREGAPEDEDMLAFLKVFFKQADSNLQKVVGYAPEPLWGDYHLVRMRETAIGNFTADILRQFAKTQIAFVNGGGIRDSFIPGKITMNHVMRVYPFNNSIVKKKVKGTDLRKALLRSISGWRKDGQDVPFGGFLQVSGLRIVAEPGRLIDVWVGNEPLKDFKSYSVAMPDFLAQGGDGYDMLEKSGEAYDTGSTMRDIFLNYVEKGGNLEKSVEGRIVRLQ